MIARPSSSRTLLQTFRLLSLLCVAHALLVLLLWIGHAFSDYAPMSGRAWLGLAWLWLIWPLLMCLHPARSTRRIFVPVFLGLVLIAPCMATIFLFSAWTLDSGSR